ncbi:hypothetical protein A3F37_03520 [Candidatus Saccharibacteria bacterium RIFCSPHIGHO2_12_FULL_41_12]|nr:MAG: hypothetical protein A3F37_03520 [Candidatus Saccharibacteria bacterium RIFCSPHIGHO2_12_FULL_41_12]
MKNFHLKIKTTIAFCYFIIALSVLFGGQGYAETVSCGPLNSVDRTICEASLTQCGDRDTDSDKACRKGFREGAKKTGDNKSDACKSFKSNNKAECENGYNAGASKQDALNKEASAQAPSPIPGSVGTHQCGNLSDKSENVNTKINFGCLGSKAPGGTGPIEDLLYALIRFLSNGIGIMMVVALIGAGIKYTTSEGNAEQTMKAKRQIQNIIIALFIYLFTYVILQFLIPGGIFK